VNTLTLNVVDHVPVDQDAKDAGTFLTVRPGTDFEAPVLFLTPRVTSILRDVFGATTEGQAPDEPEQQSSSPLADSEEQVKPRNVPTDEVHEPIDLPLYQRQMYRTDI